MRLVFRLAILSMLVLCITGCHTFGRHNLEEGIASFCNQDYRRAFVRLLPEAAHRQPDAMYAVGYMYYYGKGVTEDRRKACIWINRAAKLGQPKAIAALQIIGATADVLMNKEKLKPFNPIVVN